MIDQVNGPFAVINADDYYGVEAFQLIYDYLTTHQDDDKFRYTMVGYILGYNRYQDNGHDISWCMYDQQISMNW